MRIAVEAGTLAFRVASILASKTRDVIVCDGRRNKLLSRGSKSDRVDADKLSELLRLDALHPVFVGDDALQRLRKLSRHYRHLQADRTRVIQRLRAFLAAIGVSFTSSTFSRRAVPLRTISDSAAKLIARSLLAQIESMQPLISEARRAFVEAASRYPAHSLLQTFPHIGPIRAAELIALIGEPTRFGTVRRFWAYAGLAVECRTSSEHRIEGGRIIREVTSAGGRRLNRNCQPRLKKVFKDIALGVSLGGSILRDIYERHLRRGKRPAVARVILARRVAAVVLAMWKSQQPFDASLISDRN